MGWSANRPLKLLKWKSIIRLWQNIADFTWGGTSLETLYKVLIVFCVLFIAAGIIYWTS